MFLPQVRDRHHHVAARRQLAQPAQPQAGPAPRPGREHRRHGRAGRHDHVQERPGGVPAAAGGHRVPGRRLRADRPGAEHATWPRSSPTAPTAPCSSSTPCSGWARRWRRSSSPSSSVSASGGGCPILSTVLLVLLLLAAARLPLRGGTAGAAGRCSARPPASRARFWLFAAFAVLYGICETMNGNWSQPDMTSAARRVDDPGRARADRVLGHGHRRPAAVRGHRALAAGADRLPPAARSLLVATFALTAALPDGRAVARRRRLRARRARLLRAAAPDDQPRPGRADHHVGGRGGRGHRLLPGRLRHRRLRRRTARRPGREPVDLYGWTAAAAAAMALLSFVDRHDRPRSQPSPRTVKADCHRCMTACHLPVTSTRSPRRRARADQPGRRDPAHLHRRRRGCDRRLPERRALHGRSRAGARAVAQPPHRRSRTSYGGRDCQAPLNEPSRHDAIHGLVRWLDWSLVAHDPTRSRCRAPSARSPGTSGSSTSRSPMRSTPTGLTVTLHRRSMSTPSPRRSASGSIPTSPSAPPRRRPRPDRSRRRLPRPRTARPRPADAAGRRHARTSPRPQDRIDGAGHGVRRSGARRGRARRRPAGRPGRRSVRRAVGR